MPIVAYQEVLQINKTKDFINFGNTKNSNK